MGNLVTLNVDTPAIPANSFVLRPVHDDSDYETAAHNVQAANALLKQMEDERTVLKKPILEAGKAVDGFFKKFSEPVTAYISDQKTELLRYSNEKARIAAQKQREADEAAAAERKRLEDEAAEALAKGDVAKAESLAVVAEVVQAPVIETTAPKVAGISTRKVWKVEIVDKAAFVAAAAANPVFLAAIEIVEQTLVKLAGATEGKLEMPGVRAYQDDVMSASRRAA